MEMWKCDRCHRLVDRSERFLGRINGMWGDLCPVCYEEFRKDEELVESMHQKQLRAICIKYGFATIQAFINKEED